MILNLLTETPVCDVEPLFEQKNSNESKHLYLTGPFIVANEVNRNKRMYPLDEVVREVANFKKLIETNRAIGELEHPEHASRNSERASHLIVELKQNGNIFIGKSKVLSTPMGKIVKSLIEDGVRLGMSTRALGNLSESDGDYSVVTNLNLITVDCVADPSAPGAFVNGILESKKYVLKESGELEEIYTTFENGLKSIPKKQKEAFILEKITQFFKSLKKIGHE